MPYLSGAKPASVCKAICIENENTAKDHPVQWETLADFTDLPEGVEIVPVYDRSHLIKDAVDNLTSKLMEELIVVALVCVVFLFHVRSSLVAIITLPLGILTAFIIMYWQPL